MVSVVVGAAAILYLEEKISSLCDWQFQRRHRAENYIPVAGRETELITPVQGWPKVISVRTAATPLLCGVIGRTGRSVLNHVVGSTSRAARARE